MKSLEKKLKRYRTNVVQSMNIKEINTYLKNISENLSYLIKKDKNNIRKENDNGKYENAYDLIAGDNDDQILFLALITFHHKQGGVVECTFPSKEEIISDKKLNPLVDTKNEKIKNKNLVMEYILNNLINNCLIDGIHLTNNEANFFFIHDFPKILYCFSYYIQKSTDNGENNIQDDFQENIRECIQKSICIVSTIPLFGNIITYQNYYTHLSAQMTLYMNQKSLNDKKALNDIYIKLENEFCKEKKWQFNLRKVISILKDDFLIVLKFIILEKRIIIFSQIPSNVSLLIMALLSFFPGNYSNGKLNFDEQNGTPLKIFHENYLIYPLFTLFDLDPLLEKINNSKELNFLIGTTNNLIIKNKQLNFSCLINVDEQKVVYGENVNESIKIINGKEKKLLASIYSLINQKFLIAPEENSNSNTNNINSNNSNNASNNILNTNINLNKKIKNEEPWIISYDNGKNSNTFYLIKKSLNFYYPRILYDLSYLIEEMKVKYSNDPYIKLKQYHKSIKDNYIKYSAKQVSEKSFGNINNNNFDEEEILPYLEELLADPFSYILYTILPINFDYVFPNSDNNKSLLQKKRETILVKVNNLAFLSEWTKTRNFKRWYCSYKEQIMYYSSLNAKRALASLYDYDDNIYKGNIILGKKEGTGEYEYKAENITFSGEYKNDLRHGHGKLVSKDGSYHYVGDWVENRMEGPGILYSSKLGQYSGNFHKDYFEGKGKLEDLEKNVYEGMFHKGLKKGRGELIFNNGNVYTGEFKNDKFNGKGILKDSKGNILQEGEFRDGVLVKYKKMTNIKDEKSVKDNASLISKESSKRLPVNPLYNNEELKLYSIQRNNFIDEDENEEEKDENKEIEEGKDEKKEEIKEDRKEERKEKIKEERKEKPKDFR